MGGFDGWIHDRQGKVVRKLSVIVSIPLLATAPVFFPGALQAAAGLIAGAWMGWWLTPDIDLPTTTHEEYRAMKAGCLGALWVAMWTPYAFIVPHRSIYSHSIIGTAIRYAILLALSGIAWLLASFILSLCYIPFRYPWSVAHITFFIGLAIQDAVHYVQDGLGPLGLRRH